MVISCRQECVLRREINAASATTDPAISICSGHYPKICPNLFKFRPLPGPWFSKAWTFRAQCRWGKHSKILVSERVVSVTPSSMSVSSVNPFLILESSNHPALGPQGSFLIPAGCECSRAYASPMPRAVLPGRSVVPGCCSWGGRCARSAAGNHRWWAEEASPFVASQQCRNPDTILGAKQRLFSPPAERRSAPVKQSHAAVLVAVSDKETWLLRLRHGY